MNKKNMNEIMKEMIKVNFSYQKRMGELYNLFEKEINWNEKDEEKKHTNGNICCEGCYRIGKEDGRKENEK